MELFIRVLRDKRSYDFKRNLKQPDSWGNNDINNMLDELRLYVDESILFQAHMQTVANILDGRFIDTIAPGPFKIKAFIGEGKNADPRNFHGRIHGICNTYDLENEWIDSSCVQVTDKNRWLVHDTQKQKPSEPMQLTRVAWSAGCFIMSPSNLEAFGNILDAYKILPGTLIDGELIEVE